MFLKDEIRNQAFRRIGDQYRTFIDPNHFLGRSAFDDTWMTRPRTNLRRTNNHYDLEIGLPGYDKDNIKISVYNGVLEVIAEKAADQEVHEDEQEEYLQREMSFDGFRRKFHLRPDVDRNNITSDYKNGLLKVRLPRIIQNGNGKKVKVS